MLLLRNSCGFPGGLHLGGGRVQLGEGRHQDFVPLGRGRQHIAACVFARVDHFKPERDQAAQPAGQVRDLALKCGVGGVELAILFLHRVEFDGEADAVDRLERRQRLVPRRGADARDREIHRIAVDRCGCGGRGKGAVLLHLFCVSGLKLDKFTVCLLSWL